MKTKQCLAASNEDQNERLLSTVSLMTRWDVSRDTIRRLRVSGRLTPVFLLGTPRYRLSEVLQIEAEHA